MADNDYQIQEVSGWQRFTDNAKRAVIYASEIAEKYRNPEITSMHIFQSLIDRPTPFMAQIFDKVGLDLEKTRMQILGEIERGAKSNTTKPKFSKELKEVINHSFIIAERLSHVYVGSEHLLLAMLDMSKEEFVRELHQLGLTAPKVSDIILSLGTYPPGVLSDSGFMEDLLNGGQLNVEGESALPFFCRDMNKLAVDGKFLNITGRDSEIERVIQILARKTKNNPILVGDAGVGKTAVIEGLVQKIVREEVPTSFINKQVVSLEISSIIAGARVRGDVEERILSVVNDAIEDGDKIIFIDEIHMIVGAGSSGGRDPMDIGNILKPYLTDSDLRVIGATTMSEYRKYFDDDPALSRRFQPVDIEEINRDSALEILNNLRPDFEKYHGVKIKPEAVREAVELSAKFISDRYLPDKAIDVIDEAAASVKIGIEIQIEPALSDLGEKLVRAQKRKQNAMQNNDLKSASQHKRKEEEITDEISALIEGGQGADPKQKIVTPELVRNIVVSWTKIPLAAAEFNDNRLQDLRPQLRRRIAGQDHVVDSVVEAIKRSHLGLTDPKKPLASFIFLGPTGVGKTELAKTIAEEVFGSSELLTQINMSEFMEMHSVAKLIGSPPGYVGYQEGGQLTEQIRRRPYSVVLFDEIEKAHPEVLNLLLQILEEGELKDGRGRKANFRNTIVVLTSNIGAEEVSKDKRLGFDVAPEEVKGKELNEAFEQMRERLLASLRDRVRPELLNRIDEIAVFRGLNEEDCLVISGIMVEDLIKRLLESRIVLEVSPEVIGHINTKGYSKEYGARNIRRTIQTELETGLADYILAKNIKRPKRGMLMLKAGLSKGKVVFSKS